MLVAVNLLQSPSSAPSVSPGVGGSKPLAPRRVGAAMEGRGALLWEYRPPRAHPILYAGLLVFGFVFLTGSLENWLRDDRPLLYAVYAAPLAATALVMAALWPSPVRLHENGAAPSRPLLLRWWRPFLRWDEAAAVYPVSYDVTGAFVSPFASSDGKVTQTGVGIEDAHGRVETLRFTPTRFSLTSRRSRGYREAWDVVADAMARRGRPLVPAAPTYTETERAVLLAEARKPFLPFFAIVFLFASAAPIVWILLRAGVPTGVALAIGLAAPFGTSLRSWTASRRRNRILNALSKSAEFERGRAAAPPPAHEGPTGGAA